MPEHLSYSTLMMWERCPHRYLLSKVVEAPQKPAVYFAAGTAVHLMTEALDTGQAPSGAKFEDYFYPEVDRLMRSAGGMYWDTNTWLKGGDSLEDWLTLGPQAVKNWTEYVNKNGQSTHEIEWDITDSLPGCPVPIKAFADRVGWYDFEEKLVDMKSGKSAPKDRFQLETYVTLIGRPMTAGFFMTRDGKMVKEKLTTPDPSIGERYGKAYQEMQEAAETGDYPGSREFTCKWCPMQDNCLYYSGQTAQARKYDPYYRNGKAAF